MRGSSTGGIVTTFSGSNTYSGWTVGGGVEWAFMDRWSAKLEYLYIDFGNGPSVAMTPVLSIVSGKLTDNIVRLGINYKFFDARRVFNENKAALEAAFVFLRNRDSAFNSGGSKL